MLSIKDKDFYRLIEFIRNNFGINLKEKRTLIEGRLSHLIAEKGYDSYQVYFDAVFSKPNGEDMSQLIDRLTTNHTYFMREVSHFDFFKNTILPRLEKTVKDKDLRIWSAGCSTGEEAYTLAMILSDYFGESKAMWDTRVLATDISSAALKNAEEGAYLREEIDTLPKVWKMNYFKKISEETYAVKETLRKQIFFRSFNLMEKVYPFKKKFHVIFCRNVMIYFDAQTKIDLIQRFYDCTEAGGYLFIGHSESIDRRYSPYQYLLPSVYRKG